MNKDTACKAAATLFGLGYVPAASGTVGSAAGLVAYYFIKGNIALYSMVIVIGMIVGFLTIGRAEKSIGKKDPSAIILDEFVAMLLALYLLPVSWGYTIAAFFIFRVFDILKLPPANRLDRMDGAIGVIGDDLIAALYTNIILQIVNRLF